jgi:hypothetical protein
MKSTEVLDRMKTMFRIEEMGISEIEGKGTMGAPSKAVAEQVSIDFVSFC